MNRKFAFAVLFAAAVPTFAQEATTEPSPKTEAAPPDRPLMELLTAAGVGQPIKDAGFSLYGYASGSYTYNLRDPGDGVNVARLYETDDDRALFNQLDFNI